MDILEIESITCLRERKNSIYWPQDHFIFDFHLPLLISFFLMVHKLFFLSVYSNFEYLIYEGVQ